jgi:16S rRNA (adenine1518-N6/adenine1519-N6)-dimethyltransferase
VTRRRPAPSRRSDSSGSRQRDGQPTSRPTAGTQRRPPRRKRFGQHFLSTAWAERVVEAIAPRPGDVFLEIGSGTGALTLPLASHHVPILAVDIDRDLVAGLIERMPPHVTVMTADILHADVIPFLTGLEPQRPPGDDRPGTPPRRYRIAGNLPYYISSPILFKLIELHRRHALFADATVMVQREVADRMVARPGIKDYGVLTVMLGVHTRITRLLDLPAGAFKPPPQVRSTLVRVEFGEPAVRIRDEALFERMVKALFAQRRKTLGNALKAFHPTGRAVLALAGIDGSRRPETLEVSELAKLAELVAAVREGPML